MPIVDLVMPKMGESIMEAKVLAWLCKEGDTVQQDDFILEVATDKIDTEVPTNFTGKIHKILVPVGDIAIIGKPICQIEVETITETQSIVNDSPVESVSNSLNGSIADFSPALAPLQVPQVALQKNGERFYSPLVLKIAQTEGLSQQLLDTVVGTGLAGRVTKDDLLAFIEKAKRLPKKEAKPSIVTLEPTDTVIPMDRMRSIIAERMQASLLLSAHVTSFVECDMTDLSLWRLKVKNDFLAKYHQNLTFTPLLVQAVAKALVDFPLMNVQVDGENLVKKGNINIGMAVALPNGNLIVPVIHYANTLSLAQITERVNDLATRSRENKLKPADLEGGTYTISNIGSFGNIMGTPIIMQPQVGILAFGAITKVAAVISTNTGDEIAIRQKMYISHSYDHRVVDGSLGGMFVKRVAEYLEKFDTTAEI
jgi:2-oxoglutarate dehydrogenase E2 component (dihydrolipoamide succinyltransferase)